MESTFGQLSEKHFLCSLCDDIFSTPVTTPCGHSFCKTCLRKYWSRVSPGKCPRCNKVFSSKPHLSVNHILADVTEHYRKSRPRGMAKSRSLDGLLNESAQNPDSDPENMIEQRIQKVDMLKQALKILKSSCFREVQESHRVFSALLISVEAAHKAVVAAVEEKQREAEKRVERLVKDLEREITELKDGQTTPQDLLDTKEQFKKSFLHLPREMRDWTNVSLETEPCLGFTRNAVEDLNNTLRMEANNLSKIEMKRLQRYSAGITLNPRTAHAHLSVSEDRKRVRHTDKQREVPEHPKRFDRVTNILAKEAIESGRHYWEVDVGDKTEWDIGLAKQSVNRKGKFTVSPANGFWTLSLRNGHHFIANTTPPTSLGLTSKPRKVAVYLDYDEGRVSFFCLSSNSHIYTFSDTFTDKLHPIFNPGRPHGGKNTAPLVIGASCCTI